MKNILLLLIALTQAAASNAQQKRYVSAAVFSTQTAMPFGKFTALFTKPLHMGAELGYGKKFSIKKKTEWFMEAKAAFFYHRFVQAAIPLTFNVGYRYKIIDRFSISPSLGAGYMHSIPATAKFKLNSDGEYKNDKGIGRMQATATFNMGLSYEVLQNANRPLSVFLNYQLRLQFPFVKSYVPLLPYNSFLIGVSRPVKSK